METRPATAAAFAAALAAALLAGAPPAGRAAPRTPSPAPIYWGAHIGDVFGLASEAPWNMANTAAFAASVGKAPSLIEFGVWWYGCDSGTCRMNPFPSPQLDAIRRYGAIPVLTWASGSEVSADQSAYTLASIAGGVYDRYIVSWAKRARAWGHPFFLRFDWEMNIPGFWPWSPGTNGNTASDYVRAWRHVHDLFLEHGARNATWVWCPNIEYPDSVKPLSSLYPGPRYVDWTCLDGYNSGTNPHAVPGSSWRSFAAIFGPTYARLTRRVAPGKPVLIGETASSEQGGSKAEWIADAFGTQLPGRFPWVKAVVWFDRDNGDGMDWPLSTSPASLQAFSRAIASSYYVGNRFSRLAAEPIPPPHAVPLRAADR